MSSRPEITSSYLTAVTRGSLPHTILGVSDVEAMATSLVKEMGETELMTKNNNELTATLRTILTPYEVLFTHIAENEFPTMPTQKQTLRGRFGVGRDYHAYQHQSFIVDTNNNRYPFHMSVHTERQKVEGIWRKQRQIVPDLYIQNLVTGEAFSGSEGERDSQLSISLKEGRMQTVELFLQDSDAITRAITEETPLLHSLRRNTEQSDISSLMIRFSIGDLSKTPSSFLLIQPVPPGPNNVLDYHDNARSYYYEFDALTNKFISGTSGYGNQAKPGYKYDPTGYYGLLREVLGFIPARTHEV